MNKIKKILCIIMLSMLIFLLGCIEKPNVYTPDEEKVPHCRKFYRDGFLLEKVTTDN